MMRNACFEFVVSDTGTDTLSGVQSRRSVDEVSRRIGVMGGTFDPIHNGHLAAASEVLTQYALDEVVFVPTGRPWQKDGSEISDTEDRYAMTLLATAAHPQFRVSRVDIDRAKATYTVDTLRDLQQQYGPSAQLHFIIGADTLANILTWKYVDELFELTRFIAVNRPGTRLSIEHLPGHVKVDSIEVPDIEISSTDCRDRVRTGAPIWFLVPDAVVHYVASRGLYRSRSHE